MNHHHILKFEVQAQTLLTTVHPDLTRLIFALQVVVSVWVPSAIQLQPQDSTLNSVLPINTLLNPANCMNR